MVDGELLKVEPSLSFHLVLSASWLIGCDQPSHALPDMQSLPIGVASSPDELKSSETVNQNPCFLPSVAPASYFVVLVRRKVTNTMVLGSMAFHAEISQCIGINST